MDEQYYPITPTSAITGFLQVPERPILDVPSSCLDTPEISSLSRSPVPETGPRIDNRAIISAIRNLPEQWASINGNRTPEDLARDLADCGEKVRAFECDGCLDTQEYPVYCGFKLCSFCERRRVARLINRYVDYFDDMDTPVFITLTLQNYERYHLAEMWEDLKGYFSTLRKSKLFSPIVGGIRTFEVTWNAAAETWHLHCHVLADMAGGIFSEESGAYRIPWEALRDEWERITGGSWNVNIKRAYKDSLVEVIKYLTKSFDVLRDPFALEELIEVSYRKKLLQPFGTWFRKHKPEADKEPVICPSCKVGTLHYLCVRRPSQDAHRALRDTDVPSGYPGNNAL